MADQNMQARYQGLMGLVRLLTKQLYGNDAVQPGPAQPQAPTQGPQRVMGPSRLASGDPTQGHFDNGNIDAIRAEIDPAFKARQIRQNQQR